MFLPDRYVKGTCPKCNAEDQYGDGCEVCGAVYDAAELLNPKCSICSNIPVLKETQHAFLNLENFRDFLEPFVRDHTANEVAKNSKSGSVISYSLGVSVAMLRTLVSRSQD